MRFTNTRDDIQRLEQMETVTVSDLCDILFDLCEDVKRETGVASHALEPGSADNLLRRLPWVGRLLRRSYGEISDGIELPMAAERLKKIMEDLDGFHQKAEARNTELEELKSRQQELDRCIAADQEKGRELETLRQTLEQKERRLASVREDDLPSLREKLAKTEALLGELERERQTLEPRLTAGTASRDQLKTQVAALGQELAGLEQQASEYRTQLPRLRQQLTDRQQEQTAAREELDGIRKQLGAMAADWAQVSAELETQQKLWSASNENLLKDRSRLTSLKEQTENADRESGCLEKKIEQLERELPELQKQVQEKGELYNTIRSTYTRNGTKLESLNKDIDQLRDLVSNQDVEGILQQLRQDQQTLEASRKEYCGLEEKEAGLQEKIRTVRGQISAIESDLNTLQEELKRRSLEKAGLQSRLNSEQTAVDRNLLQALEQQIRILSGAAAALQREWPLLDPADPGGPQELAHLRDRIDQLNRVYHHHRKTYEEILDALNKCRQ